MTTKRHKKEHMLKKKNALHN